MTMLNENYLVSVSNLFRSTRFLRPENDPILDPYTPDASNLFLPVTSNLVPRLHESTGAFHHRVLAISGIRWSLESQYYHHHRSRFAPYGVAMGQARFA